MTTKKNRKSITKPKKTIKQRRTRTRKNKMLKNVIDLSNDNNNRYFVEEDYVSGDGMLTTVWGPSLWHSLHTMSFNYPVEPSKQDKKNYRNFILNLENVLPCKYCRMNLKKNFKRLPLTMEHMKSRATFSRYMYDLHEEINTMLNKKSNLTYEDVRERYEHFRARCGKRQKMKILKTRKKKHKGCTEPLYKIKSKGVVQIVPQTEKCDSIIIDDKCVMKKE